MAGLMLAFGLFFGCSTSLPPFDQAKNNFAKHDLTNALKSVNKEISAHPDNPDAYYLKGNILFEIARNNTDIADRKPTYHDMRDALTKSRQMYQKKGNSQVDVQNINDLLRNGWSNEVHHGLQLMKQDSSVQDIDYQKSIHHFDNAITLIPDSTSAYQYRARAFYKVDKIDSALATLQKIPEQNSRKVTEQMAYLYLENSDYDQAVKLYEETEFKYPEDINVLHGLTNAYIEREEHNKAVTLLDTLVSRRPNNPTYRLSYGTELYFLGTQKLDSLYESLKEATAEADSVQFSEENERKLADVDTLINHAEQQYLKANALQPYDRDIQYSTGIFYKNAAIKYSGLSPFLSDTLLQQHSNKVQTYLKAAIPYLEKVVKNSPDNKEYWRNLYELYSYFGMTEKAAEAQKKADL